MLLLVLIAVWYGWQTTTLTSGLAVIFGTVAVLWWGGWRLVRSLLILLGS